MIKLVAIDLDGTFLSSKKEHIQENLQAVEKVIAQGVKVVVCTGRTLPGVRTYLKDFPLSTDDFLILQNGAVTHQMPDFRIVAATYQSKDMRQSLIEFFMATRVGNIQLVAFDQEHLFLIADQKANEQIIYDAKALETAITPIAIDDFLQVQGIFKMMVLGDKEALDDWQGQISQVIKADFDVVRSQPVIIEFLSNNTNKATALQSLCTKLEIDRSQVMAIGDEQNDIEMLEWAEYSVAMGNASDHVKSHAKYVTATNDQAGVAQALHKLILI